MEKKKLQAREKKKKLSTMTCKSGVFNYLSAEGLGTD